MRNRSPNQDISKALQLALLGAVFLAACGQGTPQTGVSPTSGASSSPERAPQVIDPAEPAPTPNSDKPDPEAQPDSNVSDEISSYSDLPPDPLLFRNILNLEVFSLDGERIFSDPNAWAIGSAGGLIWLTSSADSGQLSVLERATGTVTPVGELPEGNWSVILTEGSHLVLRGRDAKRDLLIYVGADRELLPITLPLLTLDGVAVTQEGDALLVLGSADTDLEGNEFDRPMGMRALVDTATGAASRAVFGLGELPGGIAIRLIDGTFLVQGNTPGDSYLVDPDSLEILERGPSIILPGRPNASRRGEATAGGSVSRGRNFIVFANLFRQISLLDPMTGEIGTVIHDYLVPGSPPGSTETTVSQVSNLTLVSWGIALYDRDETPEGRDLVRADELQAVLLDTETGTVIREYRKNQDFDPGSRGLIIG